MRIARLLPVALPIVVLPLLLGQGCPPESGVPNGDPGMSAGDLTEAEKAAVNAAVNAPGAMAQATGTAQHATDPQGGSEQVLPTDICLGACPEVCKSGSLLDGEVDLSIDFTEQGCTAWVDPEDGTEYVCSGSAIGSFSQSAHSIELTFNDICCNQEALDGSASLIYDLSVQAVEFTGDWDLTWRPGDEVIGTTGAGTGGYDFVEDVTSIPAFAGTVSDRTIPEDPLEWSIEMTDILVSYLTYWSYLPYSGELALTGEDIRSLMLRFDENSPTTGEIQVSIGGGPYFAVNLFELL